MQTGSDRKRGSSPERMRGNGGELRCRARQRRLPLTRGNRRADGNPRLHASSHFPRSHRHDRLSGALSYDKVRTTLERSA